MTDLLTNFVIFFQSPQPAKPWKDVKMAIHNPPMCIQRDPFRRDDEIVGVEDCLYLNVYKPEVFFILIN